MTELLEKAFSRIRSLSQETQDELARVLLRLAGEDDAVYVVSDAEDADLAAAEAEIERGELATDDEIETMFAKYPGVRVRYSRTALRQIDEAFSFLAERSPRAASRLSERILSITTLMQEHPEAAQATSRPAVRRALLSPYPYALFYRVTADEIIVLRLRHVARRPV